MVEIINIYNGKGILNLKGGPSETFFYVNNQPRLVSYHVEMGTVATYLVGTEITEEIIASNQRYKSIVNQGAITPTLPLSSQFEHLTMLLANGTYKLQYCEFPHDLYTLPAIHHSKTNPYYEAYGGTPDLTATQTYLDQNTVNRYKQVISTGTRPIVVLFRLAESWSTFIIDGHHKLRAYQELKINPRAVVIARIDAEVSTVEHGMKTMIELGMDNQEALQGYEREKKTQAHEHNYYSFYRAGLDEIFQPVQP